MIAIMSICIGLTWGLCTSIIKQEYPTMEACMKDREYQRKANIDVWWITCSKREEKK